MTTRVIRKEIVIQTVLVMLMLAGALSLVFTLPKGALAYLCPPPQGYDQLRDAVYDQKVSIDAVESLFNEAQASVQASPLGHNERFYWLSMSEYLIGRAYGHENNKKRAGQHFDTALNYAKESLAVLEYSEGYRLMSDIISQMCLMKSIGYIVRYGPKVTRYAQKALELDPLNGKAHIILASSRIYPPTAFGGNPEEGIEKMKKALAMPGIAKDDLFNIYSGMGVGYAKLNKPQEASLWIQKALKVYPGNKYALEVSMKLR